MDNLQREKIWNELGKIDLLELPALIQQIGKYCPRTFFRYRRINKYAIIDLFENHLSFSRASVFDDPFDAYIHIDYAKVLQSLEMYKDIVVEPRRRMKEIFGISDEEASKFLEVSKIVSAYSTESFQKFVIQYKQSIRHKMCIACFSETYDNENLWLKYSDSHKGFCVEYEFIKSDLLCHDCNKVCEAYGKRISVLPVYYSQKPYDSTEYFTNEVINSSAGLLSSLGEIEAAKRMYIDSKSNRLLSLLQMSLIKNKCHEYDAEWRMLYPIPSKTDFPYICIKPSSITIGMKTDKEDEKIILNAGKSGGVKRFYRMTISRDDKFIRVPIE